MTATMPAPSRPRPPLTHEHGALFREPVYLDGPYDRGDEDDVLEDPAIITP
jgi:hypothetical protein